MIRVAVDVMGGDDAPRVPLRAALAAVRDLGPERLLLQLVGKPDVLEGFLEGEGADLRDRFRVIPARHRILPDESPVMAVRRKTESSIVRGLDLQRVGDSDAFVSAGPTGAVMAASLLRLEPLPGVDRPAVGAVFPTVASPTLVLDVGANVGCRPEHLHRFAHLGTTYARDMLARDEPRVGLLNVGEEAGKGNDLVLETHRLLSDDASIRFVGNVEGNQIIAGGCDVLVSDGFVGNVLLKFFESMTGFVTEWLESEGREDTGESLSELLSVLDYAEYGGAPLLGVDGVCIVCHGSSSVRAMENAILFAERSVRSEMVSHMVGEMERWAASHDPEGRDERGEC